MDSQLAQFLAQTYRSGPVELTRLTQGEKLVLLVRRTDGQDWIARLYPLHTADGTTELVDLLCFLETRAYPAERVIKTIDGGLTATFDNRLVLTTTFLGEPLASWQPPMADSVDSSPVSASFEHDLPLLRTVGSLLGQLHALDFSGPEAAHLPKSGMLPAHEFAAAESWLVAIQEQVPTALEGEYQELYKRIQKLSRFEDCPQALIHSDAHPGNLVARPGGGYTFVDWEVAGRGPVIVDLGFALSAWIIPAHHLSTPTGEANDFSIPIAAIHALIDGYTAHRPISQVELDLLQEAIEFRTLVTLAGAFERRCDPDYQPSERFWGAPYAGWARQVSLAGPIAQIVREYAKV